MKKLLILMFFTVLGVASGLHAGPTQQSILDQLSQQFERIATDAQTTQVGTQEQKQAFLDAIKADRALLESRDPQLMSGANLEKLTKKAQLYATMLSDSVQFELHIANLMGLMAAQQAGDAAQVAQLEQKLGIAAQPFWKKKWAKVGAGALMAAIVMAGGYTGYQKGWFGSKPEESAEQTLHRLDDLAHSGKVAEVVYEIEHMSNKKFAALDAKYIGMGSEPWTTTVAEAIRERRTHQRKQNEDKQRLNEALMTPPPTEDVDDEEPAKPATATSASPKEKGEPLITNFDKATRGRWKSFVSLKPEKQIEVLKYLVNNSLHSKLHILLNQRTKDDLAKLNEKVRKEVVGLMNSSQRKITAGKTIKAEDLLKEVTPKQADNATMILGDAAKEVQKELTAQAERTEVGNKKGPKQKAPVEELIEEQKKIAREIPAKKLTPKEQSRYRMIIKKVKRYYGDGIKSLDECADYILSNLNAQDCAILGKLQDIGRKHYMGFELAKAFNMAVEKMKAQPKK